MESRRNRLELGELALSPGEGRRLELDVDPGTMDLGGERYRPSVTPTTARLDVSRTVAGHAFRLRFGVEVIGPCVRCLERAEVGIQVDAREVHQPGSDEEEFESPYVTDDDELRLGDWAHDALVLAMPVRPLCRDDCAGLCPVCGVSLNDADPADHQHDSGHDPRWDKLRELKPD